MKDKQNTWDTRSRLGVFAGYKMKNGYEWTKRYLVWDLDVFLNANLRADVELAQLKEVKPHEVRRIRKPPGEITFPLQAAYNEVNDTLQGRKAAIQRGGRGYANRRGSSAHTTGG